MLLVYIKHVTQVRPQSTTLKYQGKQEVRRGIALNSPDFLLSLEEKLPEAKPRAKFSKVREISLPGEGGE